MFFAFSPYYIRFRPFVYIWGSVQVHTKNGKYVKKSRGFVYVLKSDGFKNDPEGSWQFVKESDEAQFIAVFETEEKDFNYPVEIFNDFKNDD